MSERPQIGVQQARDGFRHVVDEALEHETITVVTRHNRPVVAVVPYSWLERADAALAGLESALSDDDRVGQTGGS